MYLWFIDIQLCRELSILETQLWFAFKMYLWFIDIQPPVCWMFIKFSCDLLSKCIFDLLIFNFYHIRSMLLYVVICFQNVSLIYWYSTLSTCGRRFVELWFAFKMYLWFIDIQPNLENCAALYGCDLLSKCIFDLLIFNVPDAFWQGWIVVICFQNVSLIYWYSTGPNQRRHVEELWFAFKMYLWFIDIQHICFSKSPPSGCDLLSKCIFDLLIFNNK